MDWSEVPDKAARFENMVASHLLKFVQYLYEYEGYRVDLTFLRNVDKKEVDFLVTVDNKPWEPRIIKSSISHLIFTSSSAASQSRKQRLPCGKIGCASSIFKNHKQSSAVGQLQLRFRSIGRD